jgi:cation transport ATPase
VRLGTRPFLREHGIGLDGLNKEAERLAGAAMALSSVSVVANSLRLRRFTA